MQFVVNLCADLLLDRDGRGHGKAHQLSKWSAKMCWYALQTESGLFLTAEN
jgi:hypothetical protein